MASCPDPELDWTFFCVQRKIPVRKSICTEPQPRRGMRTKEHTPPIGQLLRGAPSVGPAEPLCTKALSPDGDSAALPEDVGWGGPSELHSGCTRSNITPFCPLPPGNTRRRAPEITAGLWDFRLWSWGEGVSTFRQKLCRNNTATLRKEDLRITVLQLESSRRRECKCQAPDSGTKEASTSCSSGRTVLLGLVGTGLLRLCWKGGRKCGRIANPAAHALPSAPVLYSRLCRPWPRCAIAGHGHTAYRGRALLDSCSWG
ncbi:uncharacterized protein LOC104865537 isoform X2 [Fukomys damarensis]|uniref:uncharacterized protein LOC104865537 isoform X2 n=1 Tax=Fukomys damarensis TaxID=885580 RepID=UPI00053FAE26|nr:uncharacterized protein LOC104865537 isoform X2 [Fukomys damarensis]XP_019063715.1 uncharacterized protein LOC104865537 isoform X2 [Fukomys damarensis]